MTGAPVMNALDRKVVEQEILPSGKVVWVARDLDLDGCIVQADSKPEAEAALEEARREYRAALRALVGKTPHSVAAVAPISKSGTAVAAGSYVFIVGQRGAA